MKNASESSLPIAEKLRGVRAEAFVGRTRELAELEACAEPGGALVTFIHGIGGMGKSALLDTALHRLEARGAATLRLDGRVVQPTPAGWLRALEELVGKPLPTAEEAARAFVSLGARREPSAAATPLVLAVDHYELLRLLDAWLRQCFVPLLPSRIRMIFASRSEPLPGWTSDPGWSPLLRTLRLLPLEDAAAAAMLEQRRVPVGAARRILRLAQGHPQALALAAAAAKQAPEQAFEEAVGGPVMEQLARTFLQGVHAPEVRASLEAASVVRRVTRPLLVEMVGEAQAPAALEHVLGSGFADATPEGLRIHPSVRQAIESVLRALDPARHRRLRRRAWRVIRAELWAAPPSLCWRAVADALFLVRAPLIREAFFPSDQHLFGVEAAEPADFERALRLSARFDGDVGAEALAAWWSEAPRSLHVVRDGAGRFAGFYVAATRELLESSRLRQRDPVAQRWWERLRDDPHEGALLLRRMLARDGGPQPSQARSTMILDIKRSYVENLQARYLYRATEQAELTAEEHALGFRILPQLDLPETRGGQRGSWTAVLDFGPGGIVGWLEGVVDREQGCAPEGSTARGPSDFALDRPSRSLVLEGRRVALTRLEFKLLQYLESHDDRVVERAELLENVWQQPHAGSNVVDAAVRALRKKLGREASRVETIKGFGYRYRNFAALAPEHRAG